MNSKLAACVVPVVVALCFGGCLNGKPTDVPASVNPPGKETVRPLARAEKLYAEGNTRDALLECVELTKRSPDLPGLEALRQNIVQAELVRRSKDLDAKARSSEDAMMVEAGQKGIVPATYGITLSSTGKVAAARPGPTAFQQALKQPITMHLKEADLGAIIEAIGRTRNINMVADRDLGKNRKMDVEMENVPLAEVLDYIARNLGVEFYLGENMVWVTAPSTASVPLETRLFKLKHGVQFHASDWKTLKTSPSLKGEVSGLPGLTDEATEVSSGKTSIEEVLKRFVPEVKGADIQFERNMHLLIVRNSRANLSLIEELIEALDVVPPQVLIEARFVSTRVSDLRELGIDWIMKSSFGVFQAADGRHYTQVGNGASSGFTPYGFDGTGTFPLGPQGSFGSARGSTVNPPTAAQGLNLTYRGVLTEPLFEAVLHALDISGKGRTLSVPRVTTVNNTPAKLRNGQDLLYFDEFQAQMFNTYDPVSRLTLNTGALLPRGKPVKEELGITLVAVPSVGADLNTINLMLMPTISQQTGWTDYQDGVTNSMSFRQVSVKLPLVSRQEVQTKVIVQSGETVVMGGLISSVKQNTLHKIPFLSNLPLLGKLFTRVDVTEENENLLIFVTASVVSERGETLVAQGKTGATGP